MAVEIGARARALVTEYLVRASRVAELSRFGAWSSCARHGRVQQFVDCDVGISYRANDRTCRREEERERRTNRTRTRVERSSREEAQRQQNSSCNARDTRYRWSSEKRRSPWRRTYDLSRPPFKSRLVVCAGLSHSPPLRWRASPSPHRSLDRARSLAPQPREYRPCECRSRSIPRGPAISRM